ncbi:MAG: hypothetical protein GX241_02245 [Ruminococcaceae bacterium]|nr:hypothetical protein [Oscillospiraceae bacterium]
MKNQKVQKNRPRILGIFFVLMIIVFISTLTKIQLIDKDKYARSTIKSYDIVVDAARGEIYDRIGKPLVTNRQGNSLVFNAIYFPEEQSKRNEIILSLIKLFESNNQEYNDTLPIMLNGDGTYSYVGNKEKDIEWLKSEEMLNLNDYATAENCMTALVERYSLKDYSKADAIKIASVCAEMRRIGFSKTRVYTFASDVPTDLVAIVKENGSFYQGVENSVVPYREYTDGSIAPHILGRAGNISREVYLAKQEELKKALTQAEEEKATEDEIATIKRNQYTLTDTIGNSGLEYSMESYLRGTRGLKRVSIDSEGTITENFIVEPKQGAVIISTLDADLQKVAQEALKRRVDSLNVKTLLPYVGAAVVVMNVNTGEVLAAATYPSYDNSTWKENYDIWAANPNAPFMNRAFVSTYEPGSTFKPCVAIAALEEKTITSSFTWNCNGYYPYLDHVFTCAHKKAHGVNNVTGALNDSCNCFFFETGRLLGIEKMNQWSTAFGFGQKTGVEVAESTGVLAGIQYRESQGGTWHPGDTIQAAIGQSDNQFTLLQLCNSCAIIANGGTRYIPHVVKAIMTDDFSKTILEKKPEVAVELDISQHTLNLVRKGMYLVGTEGFCAKAFANLPVVAAAKTGTSEVKKIIGGKLIEGNNGFLISYAPYENPEIAIAIVVETADTGSLTASVAADIYKYYFSEKDIETIQQYSQLLS